MVDLSFLSLIQNFFINFQPIACFLTEGPLFLLRIFGLGLNIESKIILLALTPIIVLIILFVLNLFIFSRLGSLGGLVGGLFLSDLYRLIVILTAIYAVLFGSLIFLCNYNEVSGIFGVK